MAKILEAINKAKQSVGYSELKEYQQNSAEAYLIEIKYHSHVPNLFQVIHKHGGLFS